MSQKKPPLGRGLAELLGRTLPVADADSPAAATSPRRDSDEQLAHLLKLARKGVGELIALQKQAVG